MVYPDDAAGPGVVEVNYLGAVVAGSILGQLVTIRWLG